MNFLKLALLFLSLILFFSCNSSNDYAYNEKATSIFLRQMRQIDETDRVFKDTTTIYSKGFPDSISLLSKADNLVNNSEMELADMAALKPGKEAKKFNDGVVAYLKAINDYGKTAQQMLRTNASNEKKKLHEQLMLKYEKLNTYPDRLIAIQKLYLQEVGLQPN